MISGGFGKLAVYAFLVGILLFPPLVRAEDPPTAAAFRQALRGDMGRCEELKALRALARKHGVRLWLYGGSAAAYAIKARERLLAGDQSGTRLAQMLDERQDFDLVLDGPREKMLAFQAEMRAAHPTFARRDYPFDLWTLHEDLPEAEILGIKNFGGQHTDTASIGLIEVTVPARGEKIVRDTLGGDEFFESMRNKEIRYLYDPKHADSPLAAAGKNPSVQSVIRYFTKTRRYGLASHPDDQALLARAVEAWDGRMPSDPGAAVKMMDKLRKMQAYYADDQGLDPIKATGLLRRLDEMSGLAIFDDIRPWVEKHGRVPGRTGADELLDRVSAASALLRRNIADVPRAAAKEAKRFLEDARRFGAPALQSRAMEELDALARENPDCAYRKL